MLSPQDWEQGNYIRTTCMLKKLLEIQADSIRQEKETKGTGTRWKNMTVSIQRRHDCLFQCCK